MEPVLPINKRKISLLSSGALRLTLIVGLTTLALLVPLVSAIRTTDAQSATSDPALADPPATSTPPSPTPQAVVVATQDARPAPVVVVGPGTTAPSVEPTVAPTVAPSSELTAACLLPSDGEPATAPAAWFSDNFDADNPTWRPLAGTWSVDNGSFLQSNATGYDLIAELALALPVNASVSVDMLALDGVLGGGLMIGQPTPMLRNGATIVDFTEQGRFLRWATYDRETGVYQYQGGVAMTADFDPTVAHTLAVELGPDRTRVLLDGALVAVFDPVDPGQVGLVTSASAMAFDNMVIRDLGQGTANGY